MIQIPGQQMASFLLVDLVDVLLLVPCFNDCPVETVKKFLQRFPWSACKHREGLVFIGGSRTATYGADLPDRDLAAGFHKGIDILEARGSGSSLHRLVGKLLGGLVVSCYRSLLGLREILVIVFDCSKTAPITLEQSQYGFGLRTAAQEIHCRVDAR